MSNNHYFHESNTLGNERVMGKKTILKTGSKTRKRACLAAFILFALLLTSVSYATAPVAITALTGDAITSQSVLLLIGSNSAKIQNMVVPIDAGRASTVPYLSRGRTMAPIRFLAESVGAVVSFDDQTKVATITTEQVDIQFRTGSREILINNIPVNIPVGMPEPVIINGRMFAPLRVVAEAFGMNLFFDRGLVIISPAPIDLDPIRDRSWIDQQIEGLKAISQ